MGFITTIFSLDLIPVSKTVIIVYNPFIASIISYALIREGISKRDAVAFLICTIGVILLTNPFGEGLKDSKEILGIIIAFFSSFSFNVSFVALRKLKDTSLNSWILVLIIMMVNLLSMPSIFLTYDAYNNTFTHYTNQVWILLLLIGLLTLSTLYATNMIFFYTTAGRGAAY